MTTSLITPPLFPLIKKMTDTIVDLIRHGQPKGGSVYRGHSINDPLSECGWQQMWNAVGDFNQWHNIISSPMSRCLDFSQQLSDKIHIPLQVENNLKEVGFGSWEGLSRTQVKEKNLEEYNRFYNDPVNNRAKGFEDLDAFIQRVLSAYTSIVQQHRGKHILIVAHAGVIRAILANVLHAPASGLYRIKIDNAGVSRINETTKELLFINSRP